MTNREKNARLKAELDAANQRLEEFHDIVRRKNAIIHLLAMGDLTIDEVNTSSAKEDSGPTRIQLNADGTWLTI